jgi:DNA end-binding protein Ku
MAGTENDPHPLAMDDEPANQAAPRPRALWKGTLAFGLVSIPVSLHRAVAPRSVRFHDLHDHDRGRILHRTFCSLDGESVPYGHIVKGFEVERGRWVTVTLDELEALDPVTSRTIDIQEFVLPDEIDPMLHDRVYWLLPDPDRAEAYALLGAAMERLHRVAVARVTLRARQHVAVLRPASAATAGVVLSLTTLAYADEVLPIAGSFQPKTPKERELGLAERLVSSLSGTFRSERYHDEHRQKVLAYLHRKAQELVPEPAPEPPRAPAPADLASALEASVAEAERLGEQRHKAAA